MLERLGGVKGARQGIKRENFLDSILPSTVMDLDVTVAESYGGAGNVWANLTLAPADGAGRGAYDFYRGDGVTTAAYPSFNGAAGSKAAYWETDGSQYFRLKSGNTVFLRDLHKSTGSDFWVAIAMRAVTSTETDTFMATSLRSHLTAGLFMQTTASNTIRLAQRGEGITVNSPFVNSTPGTDRLFIYSKSHANNKMRAWGQNGAMTEATNTFDATTTNASGILTLLSNEANHDPQHAGVRLYSFAMGNKYLDATEAALLIAHLEQRHGRAYVT